jgi:hypothetical protein
LFRSIGVSNFTVEDLQKLLKIAHVKPAVNQVFPLHSRVMFQGLGPKAAALALGLLSGFGLGRHHYCSPIDID